jgi:hypothetical protein
MSEGKMSEPIPFKPKDDYTEHVFIKMVDGEPVKVVDLDSMTEDQFKKYCRDTGSEWFRRTNVNLTPEIV